MAEVLNIFKLTEDLLKDITEESIIDNMPKKYRYLLHDKMFDAALDMHAVAYHASYDTENRAELLKEYLTHLKRLEGMTRVAHERRLLSHSQTDKLFLKYDSLCKQATAWRKKAKQATV